MNLATLSSFGSTKRNTSIGLLNTPAHNFLLLYLLYKCASNEVFSNTSSLTHRKTIYKEAGLQYKLCKQVLDDFENQSILIFRKGSYHIHPGNLICTGLSPYHAINPSLISRFVTLFFSFKDKESTDLFIKLDYIDKLILLTLILAMNDDFVVPSYDFHHWSAWTSIPIHQLKKRLLILQYSYCFTIDIVASSPSERSDQANVVSIFINPLHPWFIKFNANPFLAICAFGTRLYCVKSSEHSTPTASTLPIVNQRIMNGFRSMYTLSDFLNHAYNVLENTEAISKPIKKQLHQKLLEHVFPICLSYAQHLLRQVQISLPISIISERPDSEPSTEAQHTPLFFRIKEQLSSAIEQLTFPSAPFSHLISSTETAESLNTAYSYLIQQGSLYIVRELLELIEANLRTYKLPPQLDLSEIPIRFHGIVIQPETFDMEQIDKTFKRRVAATKDPDDLLRLSEPNILPMLPERYKNSLNTILFIEIPKGCQTSIRQHIDLGAMDQILKPTTLYTRKPASPSFFSFRPNYSPTRLNTVSLYKEMQFIMSLQANHQSLSKSNDYEPTADTWIDTLQYS